MQIQPEDSFMRPVVPDDGALSPAADFKATLDNTDPSDNADSHAQYPRSAGGSTEEVAGDIIANLPIANQFWPLYQRQYPPDESSELRDAGPAPGWSDPPCVIDVPFTPGMSASDYAANVVRWMTARSHFAPPSIDRQENRGSEFPDPLNDDDRPTASRGD